MDVTKQDHIDNAFRTINEWLLFQDTASIARNPQQQPSSSQQLPHRRRRRYLHALINNAGVGRTGYIDWNDISAYELCMNVNCFSQIRTVKTFLPIFKRQARDRRRHRHRLQQRRASNNDEDSSSLSSSSSRFLRSRILNINSAAGILPSGGLAASPYEVAKNAAVAFTDSLRLEMKMFDVDVVSVNPSFHATPLADPKRLEREIREQTWDPLLQSKKDEYGNEFLESYINYLAQTVSSGTWDMKVVVDTVVDHCCCVHSDSSSGQIMIGMDTKFILSPLRMLPQSIRHWIVQALLPKQIPAMMEDSYHY